MKILLGWRLITLALVLPIFGCATNGVADYRSSGINEKVVLQPMSSNGFRGVLVEMPPAPVGALESRAMEICNSLGGVKNTPTYSHTVPLGWKFYNYQCNGYKLATPISSSPNIPKIDIYPAPQSSTTPPPAESRQGISIDEAKKKCIEIGFKSATEALGKCVLQLTK